MHKRIAIIYPTIYFSTVPSLVSMVGLLVENGYEIDLFICGNSYLPYPVFNISKVKKYFLVERQDAGTIGWKVHFFFKWLPEVISECKKREYKLLMGVDPYGLVIAGIAGKLFNIPYAYFSLEIIFMNELQSKSLKILKYIERYFNRGANFSIVQDSERGALLKRENRLGDNTTLCYLPNTVDGEGKRIKSNYLREKYGISRESEIVLYSGSFHPDFMNVEIAKATQSCDRNYVFIFHSGRQIKYEDVYIKEFLKEVDNKRIIFDTTPLPDIEYEEMISSAEIGLALYKPTGSKNIYNIGLSSGKIARYLKCGLPVIVSNLPSLAQLVDEYQCGISVNTLGQLPIAIDKIISAHQFYSANAIHCFNDKYSFKKHFNGVLEQIDSLGFNGSGSDEI